MLLGFLGGVFDLLGCSWTALGTLLGSPGDVLGPLGVLLGCSLSVLEVSWEFLGVPMASWSALRGS